MRLQHASVLFVIIFIPIILVTSYFINLQVNTIRLESSYDEKLLNATYDAMTAFELNTANEDLSSVSDSLRSIIEASNNIFFNTLCTNFGVSNASKSFLQPYIPAMLYTLYDGYYIYSPTNIPEICVDKYGNTIRTSSYGVTYLEKRKGIGIYTFNQDDITEYTETEAIAGEQVAYNQLNSAGLADEYDQILYKNNDGTYSTHLHSWGGAKTSIEYKRSTYYKRDYILKSYIPYAARYSNGSNIDITINYTLDNFMTVEGKIDNIYYTKSGYLIDYGLVNKITVKPNSSALTTIDTTNWTLYSEEAIDKYIKDPYNYEVKVTLVEQTDESGSPTKTIEISNRDGKVVINGVTEYWEDAQSAVEYYADSFIFSQWFYKYLYNIKANNLTNTQYSVSDIQNAAQQNITNQTQLLKEMLHNFSTDNSLPFAKSAVGAINNPESEESNFYKHKRNVIKNSITYNLVLSMLVYTEESRTVEFSMPVLKEKEWDRILNNVSITAFMEGMRCGLKYYNNYAIVTSTNNEIAVTDNEIFYVPRARPLTGGVYALNEIDNEDALDTEYKIAHRIDCEELNLIDSYGAYSFKSKEIKYDKILDSSGKYIYDHKVYTDYNCIVDSNYTAPLSSGGRIDGNTDILKYLQENCSSTGTELQKNLYYKLLAYRIAIAKERNNLYKTTAFAENYGWQVSCFATDKTCSGSLTINVGELAPFTNKEIREIKKIEITIEGATQGSPGVYTSQVNVKYNNNNSLSYEPQTISTTSTSRRTLEYIKDFNSNNTINNIVISANNTSFKVKAIKFYYK